MSTDWLIKHQKELLYVFLAILIVSLSFGLGYLTNREFNHAPIIIEKCAV
ncbi:MAG: hypothetical protein AAB366_01825 [Patescibacteria group bacterium]